VLKKATTVLIAASLAGCAVIKNEPDSSAMPSTINCPSSATSVGIDGCEILAVGDRSTIIIGTILTEDQIFTNGSVLIDSDGKIVDVGCDLPRDAFTTVLACPDAIVSPGFINPHDHIWYNHTPPSNLTSERYEHRHHWRLGLQGHTQPDYERAASDEQVAWGEIRHALAGTTSIAGLGGVPGMVRNLEDSDLNGDLDHAAAFTTVFPLGDADGTMLADGCDYPEVVDTDTFAAAGSFQAHVAEGVDSSAANEVGCVTDMLMESSEKPSAFVHFVGATTEDAVLMRDRDISVVWSPRSNIALYGHTANVTLLDRLGVNIALSSDWLPSGSMNMLRELSCAADYSDIYLDGYFSSYELWKMATVNAARSFSLQDELGSIAPGLVADIAIFRDGPSADPFEDLINASNSDVILVLRDGDALAGKAPLLSALGGECDTLPVELACGEEIAVCVDTEFGGGLLATLAANQESYALMSCDAVPDGEPTCTPSWPGQFNGVVVIGRDDDGDGVPNDVDNCPTVFNPPRPMDGGLQPDFDQDAAGDACDENPLE
jgi:cytosine/adenosine deaminase-related metal-dependent hydrolase